jgi:hypothetical protein
MKNVAIKDVGIVGAKGETAFEILGQHTAPEVIVHVKHEGGCFVAGTEVLTASGHLAI